MRDYDHEARAMLGPYADDPTPRSRRICALYAMFYLEDPLLFGWCGLASFAARQIFHALEDTSLLTSPFDAFFAAGNLHIYEAFVPDLLRFRDGRPVPERSPLHAGFLRLARARDATDSATLDALAWEALALLSEAEQMVIVQPDYDRLHWIKRRLLGPVFHFRLGWDSAAPVIRFHGTDPGDKVQRRRWLTEGVLPAWREAQTNRPEWIRADCNLNRRDARLTLAALPPILPTPRS